MRSSPAVRISGPRFCADSPSHTRTPVRHDLFESRNAQSVSLNRGRMGRCLPAGVRTAESDGNDARPGSGKTFGLQRRVKRLVQGDGVQESRIYVGTFTRAIRRELAIALAPADPKAPQGGGISVETLHAKAHERCEKYPASHPAREFRFLLDQEQPLNKEKRAPRSSICPRNGLRASVPNGPSDKLETRPRCCEAKGGFWREPANQNNVA